MTSRLTRRRLLVVLPLASWALACDDEPGGSCPEPKPASLTDEQKKLRSSIGYVHGGAPADKACEHCLYFVAAAGCGTCEVMPGPVHPGGTCQLFRKKS